LSRGCNRLSDASCSRTCGGVLPQTRTALSCSAWNDGPIAPTGIRRRPRRFIRSTCRDLEETAGRPTPKSVQESRRIRIVCALAHKPSGICEAHIVSPRLCFCGRVVTLCHVDFNTLASTKM
jgi:hypothetical protein